MSDIPTCAETGEDVDDCPCVDVDEMLVGFEEDAYDERDAHDEREQQRLDERDRA
jgi:hypothetical protein